MPVEQSELTLIFDGHCGFCTACVRFLQRFRHSDRLTCIPCQSRRVELFSPEVGEGCGQRAWALRPTGESRTGAGAILAAIAVATGWKWVDRIYTLPFLRSAADLVYRCVAHFRGYLPGSLPYCAEHPEECDRA